MSDQCTIFGRSYSKRYDAIVVGAGIGGLFCSNLLARGGMKVLLLERHFMLGGFCSTFRRKGFIFDAATHFYPLLGNPTTLTGKLLRELNVPTEWIKMDPVDQFHLPGMPVFSLTTRMVSGWRLCTRQYDWMGSRHQPRPTRATPVSCAIML